MSFCGYDETRLPILLEEFSNVDLDYIVDRLNSIEIETPSWGYTSGGTRFFTYEDPLAARSLEEKLADAATVHRYTGVTPRVALHIPWDSAEDYAPMMELAESLSIGIGAINPNLFQDNDYMLGSITHTNPSIRRKAVGHILECVEIMKVTGSRDLSLWLSDGTNYPGVGDFRQRRHYLQSALREVYDALPDNGRILIEYKGFEPSFYHTDLADWGMATLTAMELGPSAQTLVDLGHHPLGTNIEQIVAWLIDLRRLGGFHFNSKKYADDDLTAGSVNPQELFLIFCEMVKGMEDPDVHLDPAFMIDQSHFDKPKVEGMIQSVEQILRAFARALLVDYAKLTEAQQAGDVVGAESILKNAAEADVRPLIGEARRRIGRAPDALNAYRANQDRELRARD